MMRSHLCFVAGSYAALLSACSSTVPSEESTQKNESALAPSQATSPARRRLATGQYVTPTALRGSVQQALNPGLADYPNFVAGEAVRSQLSPDGTTLAVLCAGQNSLYASDGTLDVANSTQYIFIYDVSGANKQSPLLKQVLRPTNSHVGLAFSLDGNKLYAAGGRDDVVNIFTKSGDLWAVAGTISLNHGSKGIGNGVAPNAGGLALSADGKTLVVVNNYNDSISVIDTDTATVRYEHDLRPFFAGNEGQVGGVGGTFPFAVVVKGNGIAYVTSDRDREVIAIDISSPTAGHLVKRIKLDGNALGLTLDATQSRLYVAQDNADQVAVIDTNTNSVIAKIDARAPQGTLPEGDHDARYTGAGTFSVTLSPDGRTLYAANAASNSIAVIRIEESRHARTPDYDVIGLIPTAYEPHDITFSADGSFMYIVNGKSVTGPNPDHLTSNTAAITQITYPDGGAAAAATARASNEYQFQLERASLVAAPVPSQGRELERLTAQVAENNFYASNPENERVMRFLQKRIKHVIYIVKENRTFDQMLGDLGNGANTDSSITQFGQAITPNFHRLASEFVTLDNFRDPGDGSMDGWS
jgi:YVTN family beta-propeller protein